MGHSPEEGQREQTIHEGSSSRRLLHPSPTPLRTFLRCISTPFPSPKARNVAPPLPECKKVLTSMFLEGCQRRVDRSAKVQLTKGEGVGR
ncbi:uncharacterized protein SCHCODRAFT_02059559 [Schizophyllum commune H4-8]|uniref:uncharacterized protein n=1 Tax=Schizophyllum commune (strain H4-8 / FGSC 9210) TaxID=578458 RepID=UPI002160C563|nr:uncharacterized protein SCHCODRAFT_02059559 [Schizophyllum commune H4-8]KAI5888658.1 hypothetical protein SCHCODRAFT_02059559 [Schizophyllum commune H4-8]